MSFFVFFLNMGPRLTKGTLQYSAIYRVRHILKSGKITIFFTSFKDGSFLLDA